MIDYKIISTGSKGNCVIIGDIMLDCGVPFSKIKEHLYQVKTLLITHIHSDHLNVKTLASIQRLFPHIKVYSHYETYQSAPGTKIGLINAGYEFTAGEYKIMPFECVHDVICYGYTWEVEGQRVIYATDTSTLNQAPKEKYDYMFIESNYDEKKLEAIGATFAKRGYDPFKNAKRHLSMQQCKTFYYLNRRDKESVLVELHQSARFY